ncbi:MAG: hypothetical protein ACREUZ_23005, partial [Burkholderiales bacterium]
MTFRSLLLLSVCCVCAAELPAQVGYPPNRSPFRDLELTQELTVFSGWYHAKPDPLQVAPRSGPMAGFSYQWRASGPANLTASVTRVESDRNILDPEASNTCTDKPNCKLVGSFRWPLYFFDAGLAMSLTGSRSFYRLVPDLKASIGLLSDFHTKSDVGDFAVGTRFAFNWGAGFRWVPGGSYQVRFDFTNRLYSIRYPEAYIVP